MSRIEFNGVAVDIPDGWEGELGWAGGEAPTGLALQSATGHRVVAHLANFALPTERGDYGSGAVEVMDGGAIFMSVMEFERSTDPPPLFSGRGIPAGITGGDFSPDQLQRRLPGQAGLQRWFTVGDRRFVLYVVIGSYRMREVAAPEVARMLARLTIS